MSEPFGKRHRPGARKPELAKLHKRSRPAPPALINAKLWLYIASGILFLILVGYALAAGQSG